MDTSRIDDVLAQLRAAAAAARGTARGDDVRDASSADFARMLKSAIDRVNDTQKNAERLATAFERGATDVQLHEVMISLQKAHISFQAMVQVRNKLISAYHEIMSMQV